MNLGELKAAARAPRKQVAGTERQYAYYSELADALWDRVEEMPNGCWEWQGSVGGPHPEGQKYGQFEFRGKKYKPHRLAWQLVVGQVPDGLFVCHHCDNPICCNLAHLFAGTPQENTDDMHRKGRWYVGERARGTRNGLARADEEIVLLLRGWYPTFSTPQLAEMFGLGTSTVWNIVKRNTWQHVG